MVEVDCLFQVSRDRLMRCYHIISFGALPIYFVIRSTEQSKLLLVFLDVEYDMVNRGKKTQELCTLIEDLLCLSSMLCLSFFSLIILEPLFKCRYLIKRQIVHMETQCVHVQKNIVVTESVQEIVLKPWFLMTVLQHQFDYGLNE